MFTECTKHDFPFISRRSKSLSPFFFFFPFFFLRYFFSFISSFYKRNNQTLRPLNVCPTKVYENEKEKKVKVKENKRLKWKITEKGIVFVKRKWKMGPDWHWNWHLTKTNHKTDFSHSRDSRVETHGNNYNHVKICCRSDRRTEGIRQQIKGNYLQCIQLW